MERFPKLFIVAAIGYLVIGALLGMHIITISGDPYIARFIHVHLNLLGFMAMFIYGVAYHILPRFNARPLARPGLVRTHFYLANIGLIGMVAHAPFDGIYGAGWTHTAFVLSAGIEVASILLFAWNVLPIMMPERAPAPEQLQGDEKIADVIDRYPGLLDIFVDEGFKALANKSLRESFAKRVTIAQACTIHHGDKEALLKKLNHAIATGKAGKPAAAPQTAAAPNPEQTATQAMAQGKKIDRGEKAEADTLIGSLIEVYPETKPVFEKHYGEGCFSCPGQAFETLAQTATMHGMKTEQILDEVNGIIEKADTDKGGK